MLVTLVSAAVLDEASTESQRSMYKWQVVKMSKLLA